MLSMPVFDAASSSSRSTNRPASISVQAAQTPHGVAVIEVPYVKEMIERVEFDTIYHEHLCYFSLSALYPLFRRHGLAIGDVERVPVHGGSLRVVVRRDDGAGRTSATVDTLLGEEKVRGVDALEFYQEFATTVARLMYPSTCFSSNSNEAPGAIPRASRKRSISGSESETRMKVPFSPGSSA